MKGTGRKRATSFDLIVFVVPEYWDEGVGYDYEEYRVEERQIRG